MTACRGPHSHSHIPRAPERARTDAKRTPAMRRAVLVEYFLQLPVLPDGDFLGGRSAELHKHLERFRRKVGGRYTEGTLQRLLECDNAQVRRAALLALGLQGSMASNATVAGRLHDDEPQVRRLAADALWNI